MLAICAGLLAFVSLVIPVIVLSVYCYRKENGWKTVLYGCLALILVQVIQRMIIPLTFGTASWYQTLVETPRWYYVLYSIVSALLEIGLYWLTERFLLGRLDTAGDAVVLGLSYGAMEGALFSGFGALSSLMSTLAAIGGTPQDYMLIMVEVVCMWILHALFALLVWKSQKTRDWFPLFLAFILCYATLNFGSLVLLLLGWHRAVLEAALIIAAAAAIWKIRRILQKEKNRPDSQAAPEE